MNCLRLAKRNLTGRYTLNTFTEPPSSGTLTLFHEIKTA